MNWTESEYAEYEARRGVKSSPAVTVDQQPAKESKYRNKTAIVDGIKFASRREANRYSELKVLERAGKIEDLRLQVRFPLEVNGLTIMSYVADFTYLEKGKLVVEDAKGFVNPVYRIKKKHMAAQYGIEIKET